MSRAVPLPKKVKTHLESSVRACYCEQMTSQLVAVMQRVSQQRVALRAQLRDRDLGGPSSPPASYEGMAKALEADLGLLGEVMGRAHSDVYLPLVVMLREGRGEQWEGVVSQVAEALLADITLRESIVADLGRTASSALAVPKETMRLYTSAVSSHPTLESDSDGAPGCLLRKAIDLVNLSC